VSSLAQLYDDYVSYWRLTHSTIGKRATVPFIKPPKPTPERLAALKKMAVYCVENGADPRLWLYTLFVSRAWMYPPKFEHLTPKSHLKRYRKEHRLGLFQRKMEAERHRRVKDEQYDPNRDIAASVESRKAWYVRVGNTKACMEAMDAETLGFHPKSSTCIACPIRTSCESTLRKRVAFDIVALRRGDITAAQAQAMATNFYSRRYT
jgi:hypothetical protein